MEPIRSLAELEERLSRPTPGVRETLQRIDGPVMVLGAGGKMGPSLARMVRRTLDELGHSQRAVFAVSRFSNAAAAEELRRHGLLVLSCDLLDRAAVRALPEVPNVLYLAGQKFGTSDDPDRTWAMNTLVPAIVAERFAASRTVVFSTGCVYPLVRVDGPAAPEDHPLGPPGDYANSCVGRERIFTFLARQHRTPTLLYRLSYAIDLRYGVLRDVADKIVRGEPVDVTMGWANVIWQGDANARAIQCLDHVGVPPVALNVTGLTPISIRDLAVRLGERLGRPPILTGQEAATAWLLDASQSYAWFGPPTVSLDEMIDATAEWVRLGGASLGKPTHFEVRDGQF